MVVKLFISNLAFGGMKGGCVTEDQLLPLFEQFGEVIECKVIKKQGYGFVHMKNDQAARMAVKQLNGRKVQSTTIQVKKDGESYQVKNDGKSEVTPSDCYFFQVAKNCKRGVSCPFIHRTLPEDICPAYLFSKCPDPGRCRKKHTRTGLPRVPASEEARLKGRLDSGKLRGDRGQKERKGVERPLRSLRDEARGQGNGLTDSTKSRVDYFCLDCNKSVTSAAKLESHLNTEEHWDSVKKVMGAGEELQGVVGDQGDVWCAQCRVRVDQVDWGEHEWGRKHRATVESVKCLEYMVGAGVEMVDCQLCGEEEMKMGEGREHLYLASHKERLGVWLEEDWGWTTVGESEEGRREDLNIFTPSMGCWDQAGQQRPDIHIYFIPWEMTVRSVKEVCQQFGVLSKLKMFKMISKQALSRKFKHVYINFTEAKAAETALRQLPHLLPELHKDQRLVVVEAHSEADKQVRNSTLYGIGKSIDIVKETREARGRDGSNSSGSRGRQAKFQCQFCPVVCNSERQQEEHVSQKHRVEQIMPSVWRGQRVENSPEQGDSEGDGRPDQQEYEDLGCSEDSTVSPEEQVRQINEQLRLVDLFRRGREEQLASCQRSLEVCEMEGDRAGQLSLLQRELSLHHGLREVDTVTEALQDQLDTVSSGMGGLTDLPEDLRPWQNGRKEFWARQADEKRENVEEIFISDDEAETQVCNLPERKGDVLQEQENDVVQEQENILREIRKMAEASRQLEEMDRQFALRLHHASKEETGDSVL